MAAMNAAPRTSQTINMEWDGRYTPNVSGRLGPWSMMAAAGDVEDVKKQFAVASWVYDRVERRCALD
jgi:hypothetical protein